MEIALSGLQGSDQGTLDHTEPPLNTHTPVQKKKKTSNPKVPQPADGFAGQIVQLAWMGITKFMDSLVIYPTNLYLAHSQTNQTT